MAAGILAGLLSRAVDTAPWAPPWIGQVLTPWLALAWLAGAATKHPQRFGPLLGTVTLVAVVATYLVAAGPDAGSLWPVLAMVTMCFSVGIPMPWPTHFGTQLRLADASRRGWTKSSQRE